ncbi:CaiB/BaiF CoA-transferase family protein [Sphingomonas sp.]|uniref:CaiB/BaiF CoA transferase family protein n=1 Tax=Sphingomonas sp. TaxID=28214 RepID=UPI00260D51BA|nr:CaiB/BaiF CoA-transferase family protein [Sphingomonas sp.]
MRVVGGPLAGVSVIEFAGIGPGPYCGQLLADLGADVHVFERPGGTGWANPVTERGKTKESIDLRDPAGREIALQAIDNSDVLIEGFRPGVMERLGLGPDVALGRNPRLIYGRMTGWGQDGPLAHSAGHDITYLALTGALAAIGPADRPPTPPLNLVGDFGGGALFLALGIAAALFERERSGEGQVIDAAIVDGVASLMSFFAGLQTNGGLSLARDKNLLGGANPFYRCYACADGKYLAVGPLEPQFRAEFVQRIAGSPDLDHNLDWPEQCDRLAAIFATRTRDEWAKHLEGTDACASAVLELDEATEHPHMKARAIYTLDAGVLHPAPAPRFSRTSTVLNHVPDP